MTGDRRPPATPGAGSPAGEGSDPLTSPAGTPPPPGDRPRPRLAEAAPGGFRSGPPAEPRSEPPAVPPGLASSVEGAMWELVWVKEGSEVWSLATPLGRRYLKISRAGGPDGTEAEAERLRWAEGRAPVPPVAAHLTEGDTGWLLTEALAGVPAHDPRHRMTSVLPLIEAVGRGLRRLHDTLPVAGCPFDASVAVLLERADRRVASGGVDPSTLEAAYARHSPQQLLGHAHAMRPPESPDDLVVTHGDPCLPNLLVDPGTAEVIGFVDVGRLGVSDRYRDLAIVARSVVKALDPEVLHLLFEAYGLPHPDPVRLDFYVLLDELW